MGHGWRRHGWLHGHFDTYIKVQWGCYLDSTSCGFLWRHARSPRREGCGRREGAVRDFLPHHHTHHHLKHPQHHRGPPRSGRGAMLASTEYKRVELSGVSTFRLQTFRVTISRTRPRLPESLAPLRRPLSYKVYFMRRPAPRANSSTHGRMLDTLLPFLALSSHRGHRGRAPRALSIALPSLPYIGG